mmetsp:Transcript_12181/g.17862  ORF Transcript_12181/g.17862 Transcript_12181/m.17862 type:complete len:117 (-) Transcript_12181:334-684(-)
MYQVTLLSSDQASARHLWFLYEIELIMIQAMIVIFIIIIIARHNKTQSFGEGSTDESVVRRSGVLRVSANRRKFRCATPPPYQIWCLCASGTVKLNIIYLCSVDLLNKIESSSQHN